MSATSPTIVLDVFRTLVDFDGDHVDEATWRWLAAWLGYRGVATTPSALGTAVATTTERHLAAAPSATPDVDVLDVWDEVLTDHVTEPVERRRLAADIALEWRQVTTRHIARWPGTDELLATAHAAGARLAIASNTQRAYTEPELRMLGLWDQVEAVVFSSDVLACKPDPTVVLAACGRLGVAPADVVYIGDNPLDDVDAAHAAGARCVLLERGTQPITTPTGTADVVITDGDGAAAVRAALGLLA